MRNRSCQLMLLLFLFSESLAAPPDTKPEVGKPIPDFTLENVRLYRKTTVSPKDFKGKWLFMVFWYRGCTSSINTLPKVNDLRNQFKDQSEFLVIGENNKMSFGKGIEPLYERLRKKQHLQMPYTFDSTLSHRWEIGAYPHIIIIDPESIVVSATAGGDMTAEKLDRLFQGEEVSFEPKDIVRLPFKSNDLEDTSRFLIQRSVLSHWRGERIHIPDIEYFVSNDQLPALTISMAPLYWLYNIAWFGKFAWTDRWDPMYEKIYPVPVLEIKDTTLFRHNYRKGFGYYNYHLTMPKSKRTYDQTMLAMQADLNSIFGYQAVIEERAMPVWKLIAQPHASKLLKTKGGAPGSLINVDADGGAAGFKFQNRSIDGLLGPIVRYAPNDNIPYFDETGIEHNVDITFDALMTDREDVLSNLRKLGLDLVKGEKKMKVLVIKEAN